MEAKEVIIYSIKEAYKDQVSNVLTELRSIVTQFKGLKHIQSFHTCANPLQLMDIVTWESLADAEHGIKLMKSHPDYERLNTYFEEVSYFNHFYFFM